MEGNNDFNRTSRVLKSSEAKGTLAAYSLPLESKLKSAPCNQGKFDKVIEDFSEQSKNQRIIRLD